MQMWELFRHLGFERLLQIRLLKQRRLLTVVKFLMYLALSLTLSFIQRHVAFIKSYKQDYAFHFRYKHLSSSLLLHHIE